MMNGSTPRFMRVPALLGYTSRVGHSRSAGNRVPVSLQSPKARGARRDRVARTRSFLSALWSAEVRQQTNAPRQIRSFVIDAYFKSATGGELNPTARPAIPARILGCLARGPRIGREAAFLQHLIGVDADGNPAVERQRVVRAGRSTKQPPCQDGVARSA